MPIAPRRITGAPARRAFDRRFYSHVPGINYGRRWREARIAYLTVHPWCVACLERDGDQVVATEVDHVEPHRGDADRFWNQDNWQSLCKSCHDHKTAREVRARSNL